MLNKCQRVVVASANVQNALWLFLITKTRCGQIPREPRREFRVVAFLSLPQRVVAVFGL